MSSPRPPSADEPGDATRPAETAAPGLVPEWLENLAALSWRVLVVVAFAVVLWIIASSLWVVTASIAVAIVVSAVFAPFVLRLRDRGRSRNAAAAIVWAVAVGVIVGILVVLALALLPQVGSLLSRLQDGLEAFETEAESLQIPAWVSSLFENIVDRIGDGGGDVVAGIVASVAEAGTILLLASFLVFFFLRDGDKAWLWCFESLGPEKLERITAAGDDALERVGGYLRGTTVLAAVTALANYVFMLLLGVPLALALAIFSFAAMYIPYFGGIASTLAILAVTYGALGTGPTLVMLVLLSLRTFFVGYFLRPTIYGRTVHIHPALVLLVLPAGLQLAGLVGLFAAVPVTAVIMTVAQSAIAIVEPDAPPKLPDLVPAWLDRAAQWSWRALVAIALAVLLIIILTTVPLVVIPVILALIFAATLQPVVDWLIGRGRARGSATGIAVAGATFAILGVLALTLVSLVEQAGAVGNTAVSGAEMVNESADGHLGLGVDGISVGVESAVDAILTASKDLAGVGTIVLLAVLLTFYFLKDGAELWRRVMAHTRSDAARELSEAGSKAFGVLGGYMTGTAAISFVGAFSQWVIMVVLGLPLALPVFVLSFFGGFIPYIGSLLTTGLAFLIAVAAGDTLDVVVMGIWTLAFNLVQGNVVAPLVYGRTTHIHPAIVLVAIPAGSAVAGILGMFVVVPVLGVVAATWRTALKVMGSDVQPRERGDPRDLDEPDGPDEPALEPMGTA